MIRLTRVDDGRYEESERLIMQEHRRAIEAAVRERECDEVDAAISAEWARIRERDGECRAE